MPAPQFPNGPFGAFYVGNADDLVTPLTRVGSFRLQGTSISEELESEHTPLIGDDEQVGDLISSFTFTFIPDDMVKRLRRRLSVTESNLNSAPGSQKYTCLLLYPISTYKASLVFDQIRVVRSYEWTNAKNEVTAIELTFQNRDRDASVPPFEEGTHTEVAGFLGVRSPI